MNSGAEISPEARRRNRRSLRLQGYDYSQAGAYFVTICTQNRECLFGDVVQGRMMLSDAGKMVEAVWEELPLQYPGVMTDMYQVMPNHFHGIIVLVGAGPCACPSGSGQPQGVAPTVCGSGQPQGVAPTIGGSGQTQGFAPTRRLSLPDVIHRFKSFTTKRYSDGVKHLGWRAFPGRLRQRNYYERVIRDEIELLEIRDYVLSNPAKWGLDRENPDVVLEPARDLYERLYWS